MMISFAQAVARTAGNDAGTPPGITIGGDNDPYFADWAQIDGDPGTTEDGQLNGGSADAILAEHGWTRTEPWQESGDRWTARVESRDEE